MNVLKCVMTVLLYMFCTLTFQAQTNLALTITSDYSLRVPLVEPAKDESFFERMIPVSLGQLNQNAQRSLVIPQFKNFGIRPNDDLYNRDGLKVVSESFIYGSRKCAEDLPLFENMIYYASKFFRNTIGGVDEQLSNPTSLIYQPTEASMWERLRKDGYLTYGLRPNFNSPYAFVATHLSIDNEEIVRINLRYYYQSWQFNKFRLLASFPLPGGWEFNTGFVFSPDNQFRKNNREYTWTCRVEHEFGLGKENVFFVGTQISGQSRAIVGLLGSF